MPPLEDTGQKKITIASLDGVRAIACLIVLSYHISLITRDTHLWQPNIAFTSAILLSGNSGVTLFFVLSGFLLFLPYAKSFLFASAWPSARVFYVRRVFRIVPAYYVALFLLILLFPHPEYLHADHLQDLGLFLTFFMDSTQQTYRQINGPFWTLAVEAQYYMLLPLLMLSFSGFLSLVRRKWGRSPQQRFWVIACCLLGMIAWGLCWRYWGVYFVLRHPSSTFLLPRPVLDGVFFLTFGRTGKYLEDFAVGMLISLCFTYTQRMSPDDTLPSRVRHLSPWLFSSGILVLLSMSLWQFNQNHLHTWPLFDGLHEAFDWLNEIGYSLGFGLCVTAILFGPAILRRPFEWHPLRWLGLISYSLYIWHLPLLIWFMVHVGYNATQWNHALVYSLYWLWAALFIIPFAFLSYMLVEKPWIEAGARLLRKGLAPTEQRFP